MRNSNRLTKLERQAAPADGPIEYVVIWDAADLPQPEPGERQIIIRWEDDRQPSGDHLID